MSKIKIYKNLFNHDDLNHIRNYYTKVYNNSKENLCSIFKSGVEKLDFYPGFYFLIHRNLKNDYLKSGINENLKNRGSEENTIVIQGQPIQYTKVKFLRPNNQGIQFAYVIELGNDPNTQPQILNVINTIKQNNFNMSFDSIACTMQESGHMIHTHKDGGVHGRYHIVLNQDAEDYFYIENKGYKLNFGDMFYVETSTCNHTFMHFSNKLRIHLIFDEPQ